MFGYNVVKIICSGSLNRKKELEIFMPMVRKKDTSNILDIIFNKKQMYDEKSMKYSSKYLFVRYLLLLTFTSIVGLVLLMYFRVNVIAFIPYFCFVILILSLLFAYSKTGINKDNIISKSGIFLKTTTVIFYDKIKHISQISTPFTYIFNISKLELYVSSNGELKKAQTCYLNNKDIDYVKNKILEYA